MSIGDFGDLVNLLNKGGVVAILALNLFVVAVGAFKGWWVPGPTHESLRSRCDKAERKSDHWQQLALQALTDADKGTSLAEFFRDEAGAR